MPFLTGNLFAIRVTLPVTITHLDLFTSHMETHNISKGGQENNRCSVDKVIRDSPQMVMSEPSRLIAKPKRLNKHNCYPQSEEKF